MLFFTGCLLSFLPLGEITMDAILSRLKQLSSDELREEVVRAGLKCGPITSTTRFIFEKKLAQALLEQQEGLEGKGSAPSEEAAGNVPSDSSQAEALKASKTTAVNHNSHGSVSEDTDFGYCVGLNPPEEDDVIHTNCSTPVCGTGCVGSQISTQTPSKEPPLFYGVCPVYDDILARNGKYYFLFFPVINILQSCLNRFFFCIAGDTNSPVFKGYLNYCFVFLNGICWIF